MTGRLETAKMPRNVPCERCGRTGQKVERVTEAGKTIWACWLGCRQAPPGTPDDFGMPPQMPPAKEKKAK